MRSSQFPFVRRMPPDIIRRRIQWPPLVPYCAFFAIGVFVAVASGCDTESWFNADGSGRFRIIYDEEAIKAAEAEGHGFDQQFKEALAKSKLRAKMTRDVVFGKRRWIYEIEYDSDDQLSWIDDEKGKHDTQLWKSTSEPDGALKYTFVIELEANSKVGPVGPRQVTVHLPGQIISSNADTVDEKEKIATWDRTNHKSITPTVVVRLPRPAKKDDAKKLLIPGGIQ